MTRANLLCFPGAIAIVGGLYLVHPALACIGGGVLLLFLGIVEQLKRKDTPQ